jgi:hypothetical protein
MHAPSTRSGLRRHRVFLASPAAGHGAQPRTCGGRVARRARRARLGRALLLGCALAAAPAVNAQVLEGTLGAGDSTSGQSFGQAVAMDGDVAIIGASGSDSNEGAVYVYRRAAGTWSQEAKLSPGDLGIADLFGFGVALAGDLAVGGAPDSLDLIGGSATGPGAVYLFRDAGGTWPQEDKLQASDGQAWDRFGWSVAAGGDVVVVGAPGDETAGSGTRNGGRGAVYVYRFDGADWSEDAKLTASDGDAGDQFGYAVRVDGDVIVVGAPDDEDAGTLAGAVYVFRHDGSAWVEEEKLLASDAAVEDVFGTAVAASGDAILVGAPQDDDDGLYSGSVYVYRHDGSGWVEEDKLASADATANAYFGRSVALRGARALVGAPGQVGGEGKAYTFTLGGSSWSEEAQLSAAGAVFLGHSGDLDDAGAVVGAPLSNNPPSPLAGLAYVFGLFDDCNGNGTPDDEDIATGTSQDCNTNGIPDECEPDCNGNGVPDDCDIGSGTSQDCNGNGVPDECDITAGTSQDCNANGIPDECEPDCNGNGVPDDCDIATGTSQDCNGNGVPDECDITAGTSLDGNGNGIPDECEGVWTDLGLGLAGSAGVPVFTGSGPLIVGLPVTLTLTGALPNSSSALFIGFSELGLPFKGGTLVPSPDVILQGLPTGPAGTLALTSNWPPGIPSGFTLYFQHWILDPAGPQNLAASNGLSGTTP